MRRLVSVIAALVVATGTVVGVSAAPVSAQSNCTAEKTGYIPDTVFVPPGATCVLTNATVIGSVMIQPSGILRVFNSNLFGYMVSADNPGGFFITGSTVYGSVVINRLTPTSFFPNGICSSLLGGYLVFAASAPWSTFTVGPGFLGGDEGPALCSSANTIRGSVSFQSNQGRFQFGGNTVYGSVQASYNTGGGAINNNTIFGSLSCFYNNPAVTKSNNHANGATYC
ncbi:MAG TPA: hypothetical protein VG076_11060 [Acidimicrobiales bacterium]|jgi:hypothetical protein|nr:hypothetical protein [Acidimicrobiales bacterium]